MSFAAAFRKQLTGSAGDAAQQELPKTAAPRWLREWMDRGGARSVQWRTPSGVVSGEDLRQVMGYAPEHQGNLRTKFRSDRYRPGRVEVKQHGGWSQAHEAATRLRFSGAHAIRPNEVGVPATFWGETVAAPAAIAGRPRLIYRGNAVNAKGNIATGGVPVVHGSRHPDVAANYALGRASAAQAPNRVVTAYPARRFIEGTADTVAARLGARGGALRSSSPSLKPHAGGYSVPTYEAGVQQARLPRAVGEYAVRPATMQGRPVFALSRLSGLPVQKAFAPWVGGNS